MSSSNTQEFLGSLRFQRPVGRLKLGAEVGVGREMENAESQMLRMERSERELFKDKEFLGLLRFQRPVGPLKLGAEVGVGYDMGSSEA